MKNFLEKMKADVEGQRARTIDSLVKMEGALEAIRVVLEELDKREKENGQG